jgi:hypothetical protein
VRDRQRRLVGIGALQKPQRRRLGRQRRPEPDRVVGASRLDALGVRRRLECGEIGRRAQRWQRLADQGVEADGLASSGSLAVFPRC